MFAPFTVAAPSLWNKLSIDIKTAASLNDFKQMIKAFLFNEPIYVCFICFNSYCNHIFYLYFNSLLSAFDQFGKNAIKYLNHYYYNYYYYY